MSLTVGGSQSIQREHMHSLEEHANFTQKGLIELVELNQGPSCCEGTVLTSEAPRYHGSKFCRMFPVHMGICRMEIWMKEQ